MATAAMKAARQKRDQTILDLFLAGHTQRAIAENPQIKLGVSRVNQIIKAELDRATKDHILRNENAALIWQARMEVLVREAFEHVTEDHDLKAIEVCRRLMADQAKMADIADGAITSGPVPPMGDTELDDGEPADELARYRAQRKTGVSTAL
jgi:hypothetical protein